MNASTRLIATTSIYTLYLPCKSTTSEDQFNSRQSHGENIFRVIFVYRFCSSTKPNEYRNRTQDILIPVNSFNPPLGFCAQLVLINLMRHALILPRCVHGPYCIYVFQNKLKTLYTDVSILFKTQYPPFSSVLCHVYNEVLSFDMHVRVPSHPYVGFVRNTTRCLT